MRANERWLNEYRKKHPERVSDPFGKENRVEDSGGIIRLATWEFDVLPPLYNDCLRLFKYHNNLYYGKLNAWAERLSIEAHREEGAGARFHSPISIKMERHSSGTPDLDGLYGSFKMILDGLVRSGLIEDDDPNAVSKIEASHTKTKEDAQRVILRFSPG